MTVAAEGPRGRNRRSDALRRVFFLHQVDPGRARAYVEREGALAAERHEGLLELEWAAWAAEHISDRTPGDTERP